MLSHNNGGPPAPVPEKEEEGDKRLLILMVAVALLLALGGGYLWHSSRSARSVSATRERAKAEGLILAQAAAAARTQPAQEKGIASAVRRKFVRLNWLASLRFWSAGRSNAIGVSREHPGQYQDQEQEYGSEQNDVGEEHAVAQSGQQSSRSSAASGSGRAPSRSGTYSAEAPEKPAAEHRPSQTGGIGAFGFTGNSTLSSLKGAVRSSASGARSNSGDSSRAMASKDFGGGDAQSTLGYGEKNRVQLDKLRPSASPGLLRGVDIIASIMRTLRASKVGKPELDGNSTQIGLKDDAQFQHDQHNAEHGGQGGGSPSGGATDAAGAVGNVNVVGEGGPATITAPSENYVNQYGQERPATGLVKPGVFKYEDSDGNLHVADKSDKMEKVYAPGGDTLISCRNPSTGEIIKAGAGGCK